MKREIALASMLGLALIGCRDNRKDANTPVGQNSTQSVVLEDRIASIEDNLAEIAGKNPDFKELLSSSATANETFSIDDMRYQVRIYKEDSKTTILLYFEDMKKNQERRIPLALNMYVSNMVATMGTNGLSFAETPYGCQELGTGPGTRKMDLVFTERSGHKYSIELDFKTNNITLNEDYHSPAKKIHQTNKDTNLL